MMAVVVFFHMNVFVLEDQSETFCVCVCVWIRLKASTYVFDRFTFSSSACLSCEVACFSYLWADLLLHKNVRAFHIGMYVYWPSSAFCVASLLLWADYIKWWQRSNFVVTRCTLRLTSHYWLFQSRLLLLDFTILVIHSFKQLSCKWCSFFVHWTCPRRGTTVATWQFTVQ